MTQSVRSMSRATLCSDSLSIAPGSQKAYNKTEANPASTSGKLSSVDVVGESNDLVTPCLGQASKNRVRRTPLSAQGEAALHSPRVTGVARRGG
jgi:hypothetical protein